MDDFCELTFKEIAFLRKEIRVIKKMIGDKYAIDTEAEEEKEINPSPNEEEA